jgi:hypothetical protein
MKTNKFLLTLALCAGLQFNAHAAEQAETPTTEQSYWQMYAPQRAQDAATATYDYAASWIPQSVKDRVNSWSTRKKIAVASAIIGSLAAIYNRDQIIEWISPDLHKEFHNQYLYDKTIWELKNLKTWIDWAKKPLENKALEKTAHRRADEMFDQNIDNADSLHELAKNLYDLQYHLIRPSDETITKVRALVLLFNRIAPNQIARPH